MTSKMARAIDFTRGLYRDTNVGDAPDDLREALLKHWNGLVGIRVAHRPTPRREKNIDTIVLRVDEGRDKDSPPIHGGKEIDFDSVLEAIMKIIVGCSRSIVEDGDAPDSIGFYIYFKKNGKRNHPKEPISVDASTVDDEYIESGSQLSFFNGEDDDPRIRMFSEMLTMQAGYYESQQRQTEQNLSTVVSMLVDQNKQLHNLILSTQAANTQQLKPLTDMLHYMGGIANQSFMIANDFLTKRDEIESQRIQAEMSSKRTEELLKTLSPASKIIAAGFAKWIGKKMAERGISNTHIEDIQDPKQRSQEPSESHHNNEVANPLVECIDLFKASLTPAQWVSLSEKVSRPSREMVINVMESSTDDEVKASWQKLQDHDGALVELIHFGNSNLSEEQANYLMEISELISKYEVRADEKN